MSDKTATMTTRYTTAPADYDYADTRVIEEKAGKCKSSGKIYRRVEIPANKISYQEGRYWSGMHRPWSPTEYAEMIDYGLVNCRPEVW